MRICSNCGVDAVWNPEPDEPLLCRRCTLAKDEEEKAHRLATLWREAGIPENEIYDLLESANLI